MLLDANCKQVGAITLCESAGYEMV